MDCRCGRILEPNEGYIYYTDQKGQHRCIYTYHTKDGDALTFEGEKLFDCIIQRDELLRKTGSMGQERIEIQSRPSGAQRWDRLEQQMRTAIGCLLTIGRQVEQEARRQRSKKMERVATLAVDSCSGLQKMIDSVEAEGHER